MGTHERSAAATPHVGVPPVAVPPVVAAPTPPSVPPVPLMPPDQPDQPPAGSSGLVPLRPGLAGLASAPASTGFVPGRPVTAGSATRVRWDDRGARRRASATTFGLTGRIVITVVVVLVVAVLSYGNVFGIPLFLAAAGWLLRDLWAKARVAPPRAPVAPTPGRSPFPPPPTSPAD